MKILVLADNYKPEIAATSFRTCEHAKVWLEQGHEVTVVTCAPNWPQGRVFNGYKNRLYQEEWIDGVRVIRLGTYIAANQGFFHRTLDFVSYMVSATAWCWRFPEFDVILATSPQFFTAVAGWTVSRLRRRPWIFELRDIWPESLRAVGVGKEKLIRVLEKLELLLYRKSDRIIALTRSFKQNLIERGICHEKIDVVTNGVDLDHINPTLVKFDARERLGIASDDFLVGYIGTTGMAHGLETLIEAAEYCKDQPDIKFLIMGQGARRDALEQRVQELALTNVRFADSVPHEEVPSYYAALDLSVIHLRPDPLFRTVIPSKIFECMAMGCPMLMAVEGESADIVESAGAGVCIASGNPQAMAEQVSRLRHDPEGLATLGAQGRQAALTLYNRRSRAEEVLQCLESVVNGKQSSSAAATYEAAPDMKKAA